MNGKAFRRAAGQNLIEFAITFPIFIFIVLIVFDLGRIVYSANALQNATREGARLAIVNNCITNANLTTFVRNRAVAVDPADITNVSVVWGEETVQVRAEAKFRPLIPVYNLPIIKWAFPVMDAGNPADPSDDIRGIKLTSRSTMQRETWKDCGP